MIRQTRIPKERLPVIIGKSGEVKEKLEEMTHTNIVIDEEISIEGDALDVMTAENIVKAIGRGFSPQNAFDLLDEENNLYMIDLPKNEKSASRMRSRLIGEKGKCRRNLEMLTKTKISIYGRTVSIIGRYEDIEKAEKAIRKIMAGTPHRYVYEYLEKK